MGRGEDREKGTENKLTKYNYKQLNIRKIKNRVYGKREIAFMLS